MLAKTPEVLVSLHAILRLPGAAGSGSDPGVRPGLIPERGLFSVLEGRVRVRSRGVISLQKEELMNLIIILIILAVIVLAVVSIYNKLVRLRNTVKSSWSDIDVQCKKRYDLVPNLVETVKGYAAHEKSVFENVTKARSMAMQATTPAEMAKAENMFRGYPEEPLRGGRGLPGVKSQHELPPASIPASGPGEQYRIGKKVLQCHRPGLQHLNRNVSVEPDRLHVQLQKRRTLSARGAGSREKSTEGELFVKTETEG